MKIVVTGAPFQEQTASTETPAAVASPDPPGTIDGAKNPELIPDEVAYRLVILAVAEPPDASEEAKERARAKMNPAALSEDDKEAFLGLLSEFRAQLEPLDRQAAEVYVRAPIPHPASTDFKLLLELGKQRDQLLSNTIAGLPARLSEDGLEKLRAHLQEAKRGMKIIPPDPLITK